MQPAEVWDLMDDFRLEARLLVQEPQLLLPAEIGRADFEALSLSRVLQPRSHLSADLCMNFLLICAKTRSDVLRYVKAEQVRLKL